MTGTAAARGRCAPWPSRRRIRPFISLVVLLALGATVIACTAEEPPEPTPTVLAATAMPEPAPTPTPTPEAPLFPEFGYGMQIDPSNDLPRSFQLLKEVGFEWAKVQIRWDGIEAERGATDWSFLDLIVAQAQRAEIKLLFSVVAAPSWARPEGADRNEAGPPEDPEDMAGFLGRMAARYAGRVHAYEVWNEQNLAREWGGEKPDAAQYVALLEAAYAAIKSSDAEAIVVAGALTPAGDVDLGQGLLARDDRAYLREMYEAGMQGSYDVLGVHPSGFNNPPGDDPDTNSTDSSDFKGHWSFYFRNFENYRAVMEEFGDGDKELWFTEFGWASSPDPAPEYKYASEISPETQAEYLVEAIDVARRSGYVGAVFLWNLSFAPGADEADIQGKRAFSILNRDWSPRPAFDALRDLRK